MADELTITIDGREVRARRGETILEAAQRAGIYIPRLCYLEGVEPYGGCRVCMVRANGRPVSACTHPVSDALSVENETKEINEWRRSIIEMLLIEGNHFCMFCEKSGNCELQAMAYRLGIPAPRYPALWPKREVDASHPDILIDHNRCIYCARCVRTSRDLDGKAVFDFVDRGINKRLTVASDARLIDSDLDVADRAVDVCPVGAILRKRNAYRTPIGQRAYDHEPIGAEIEKPVELTIEKGGAT